MIKLKHRDDGWWITGLPETEDCGPYDIRAEAKEDQEGLVDFFFTENDRKSFTVDPDRPKLSQAQIEKTRKRESAIIVSSGETLQELDD
jgi:hypothetical protein